MNKGYMMMGADNYVLERFQGLDYVFQINL